MSPYVAELSNYLAKFTDRCREARWLRQLLHVRVCTDIAEDIATEQEKAAALAYAAEQEDLLAQKELFAALADGLDNSDLPAVKRAMANLGRSAKRDHEISALMSGGVFLCPKKP